MNHIFSVEFATENSIEEAVILENLFYWCNKNKANGTNFFDNDYWTYNSVRAFNKLFPYLSPRKIEGALKRLEQKGYIKIGNYNSNPYDRTKWYAVTEKGNAYFIIDKSITQNCEMDKYENVNEFPQNGKSYKDTDINTDINTNINTDNCEIKKFTSKVLKKQKSEDEQIQELIYLQNLEIQDNLNEFVKMRKRIKKPFSFYAFKLMLKKLEKMGNIKDQNKILENSIMNNWQGIFELKEEVKKTKAGYVDTCNTDYQDGMDLWK